jgi:hypothetical protein
MLRARLSVVAAQPGDAAVPHRKIGADRVVPEPVDHGGAADHEVMHCHLRHRRG